MSEVEVVNIVGTGTLDAELSLEQLASDLGSRARYKPEMHPGMYVRVEENDPLTTVYRTGKFIVVGVTTEDELYAIKEKVLTALSNTVGQQLEAVEFAISNYVCSADLGQELELEALTISLGLEQTEYEPEQFGGLIYKPDGLDATLMVFRTGRIIITGVTSKEEAEQAFHHLTRRVEASLQEEA